MNRTIFAKDSLDELNNTYALPDETVDFIYLEHSRVLESKGHAEEKKVHKGGYSALHDIGVSCHEALRSQSLQYLHFQFLRMIMLHQAPIIVVQPTP